MGEETCLVIVDFACCHLSDLDLSHEDSTHWEGSYGRNPVIMGTTILTYGANPPYEEGKSVFYFSTSAEHMVPSEVSKTKATGRTHIAKLDGEMLQLDFKYLETGKEETVRIPVHQIWDQYVLNDCVNICNLDPFQL